VSDSIQEQIVTKIATALAGITVANGYANTLASVQRHNQTGMNLGTLPTVLIREGECHPDLEKSARPNVRRRMEVYLVVVAQQDEADLTMTGGRLLNSFVADIERRIGASQNWDGLAIMTDPPSYLEVDVDATTPQLARGLRVDVTYQHLRTDPYSQ
jgi:hypothetical protein